MSVEPPIDFLERQEWLEPVETATQKAVGSVFEGAGTAGRRIQDFLHGTWLGHPLHPVLTDVPLGAWTAALVLDCADASGRKDCRSGADLAIRVGLAGAGLAAVAGLTDWHVTDGPARRVGIVHGMLNIIGAGLYAASLVARQKRNRSAGRSLAFLGYAVAAASAYLGGNLVYAKQIGVNHTAAQPVPCDWTPVMDERDLPEGKLHRGEANGVRVLLVLNAGHIRCISEVCSHLGGPLAEGRLSDDTVTCPWHGSIFSLDDGSVIHGPATHPQPCFETRVNGGRIEVKTRPQD
ncbi:MAG: Rieske (2Fe-2S) protein [Bryobacteraceae bacterium]